MSRQILARLTPTKNLQLCDKKSASVRRPLAGYAGSLARSNWNWECWFLWRELNRKTLDVAAIEPGPHCCEAGALTTALSLLPNFRAQRFTASRASRAESHRATHQVMMMTQKFKRLASGKGR